MPKYTNWRVVGFTNLTSFRSFHCYAMVINNNNNNNNNKYLLEESCTFFSYEVYKLIILLLYYTKGIQIKINILSMLSPETIIYIYILYIYIYILYIMIYYYVIACIHHVSHNPHVNLCLADILGLTISVGLTLTLAACLEDRLV